VDRAHDDEVAGEYGWTPPPLLYRYIGLEPEYSAQPFKVASGIDRLETLPPEAG
jgi:hypothetical protein